MSNTLPMYDGPPVASKDVVEIYVVVNGALGMSAGKIAAQVFHAGWLANYLVATGDGWKEQGRRVSVRIAETPHVFERVRAECLGMNQRDEGLREVERGSITAFVTIPYRRGDAPKILSHKKVQAYEA